jgi:alkylation response protein AidB-like acyl-CoA dehydrogenase
VDVRLSPEQVALRDSAAQVVERLGPSTVAGLDDSERAGKLDAAVVAAGWHELRTPTDEGSPWASGVEVAVIAEELGRGLADVSFLGPTLAADLRRRAGAPTEGWAETVALTPDLTRLAEARNGLGASELVAIDARAATAALILLPAGADWTLGAVALGDTVAGADLTRPTARGREGESVTPVAGQTRPIDADDLARWQSLGLAVACADLVGAMRGTLTLANEYARERRQYGAAIGSFQAVQHLLADAHVATEGSRSIALHAAWAVDALAADDALAAASAAKAYCARAARSVCETSIQVHGGIGNTWECLAHVFLRRTLFSTEVLGGIGDNLQRVLAARGVGGDNVGGERGLR